jgi:hypothetical protein
MLKKVKKVEKKIERPVEKKIEKKAETPKKLPRSSRTLKEPVKVEKVEDEKKPAKKAGKKKASKDDADSDGKESSDIQRVEELVSELDGIKEKQKLLEGRATKLKNELGLKLEKVGVKDDKGSYAYILGDRIIRKEARKSIKLNEQEAEDLFKAMKIWRKVTETKTTINEDLVEQAVSSGLLKEEQLESVCDIKTTYAITFRKNEPQKNSEEMPEVQVSKMKKSR